MRELSERLRVFLDAGLLRAIPTAFQIRQGELAMLLYVVSSDATDESRYVGRPLGHPLVRQPLILSQVGVDHLDPGCSLGARLSSVATHVLFTFHQGMPVYDLQLMQTHANGLSWFRREVEEHLDGRTPRARRRNALLATILNDPAEYHRRFLGEDGYIARAERLDYPRPEDEGSDFPPEFFSLVGFLDHCASAYPRSPSEVGALRLPTHLARLATRRIREGKGVALGRIRARDGETR